VLIGMKRKAETRGLEAAQKDEASIRLTSRSMVCMVIAKCVSMTEAVAMSLRGSTLPTEEADNGHHATSSSGRRERARAGELCGVAERRLDELRDEDSGAVDEKPRTNINKKLMASCALEEGEFRMGRWPSRSC